MRTVGRIIDGVFVLVSGEQEEPDKPRKRTGNHWRARGHRSKAIAVPVSQAEEFTREAQKAKIDGHYDKRTGEFVANSRKARMQEAQRRGNFYDGDGGYYEDKFRK